MSEDNKIDTTKEDKLAALKAKADVMGITYNVNIGYDKLKLKMDLALEDVATTTKSVGPSKQVLTAEEKAKKPVLAIVHDLDPTQQNDPTIVINIGNKFFKVGCIITKEEEQLIPACVIKSLQAKTMVQWVAQKHAITKRPTGNKIAKTTKRYNVQILDLNPEV